jgi:hypothetical protein
MLLERKRELPASGQEPDPSNMPLTHPLREWDVVDAPAHLNTGQAGQSKSHQLSLEEYKWRVLLQHILARSYKT